MVARDPYTVGHEKRVAGIALRIAQRMGYDEQRGHVVYLAALIHDIGKIKVPIELLTKPTPLRPEEFAIIKEHAAASYEILSKIAWPWPLADIAGQHHEKIGRQRLSARPERRSDSTRGTHPRGCRHY